MYTGVGKSRFTVLRMEKDIQVMIITIDLLITKTIIIIIIIIIMTNKKTNMQINNTIINK
jgi:hypothetical protein